MTTPTFKTLDYDTAAGVLNFSNELPKIEIDPATGIATFIFSDPAAPEAARNFRVDEKLQNYISAKKLVLRLFRQARDRGRR